MMNSGLIGHRVLYSSPRALLLSATVHRLRKVIAILNMDYDWIALREHANSIHMDA